MKIDESKNNYTDSDLLKIEELINYISSSDKIQPNKIKEITNGLVVGAELKAISSLVNSGSKSKESYKGVVDSLIDLNNSNMEIMNSHMEDMTREVKGNLAISYVEYFSQVRNNANNVIENKSSTPEQKKAAKEKLKRTERVVEQLEVDPENKDLQNDESYLQFIRYKMLEEYKIEEDDLNRFEEILNSKGLNLASNYSEVKDLNEEEAKTFSEVFFNIYDSQKKVDSPNNLIKNRDEFTENHDDFKNGLKNYFTRENITKTLSAGMMVVNFPQGLVVKAAVKTLMKTPIGTAISDKISALTSKLQNSDPNSGFNWKRLGAYSLVLGVGVAVGVLGCNAYDNYSMISESSGKDSVVLDGVSKDGINMDAHEKVMENIQSAESEYEKGLREEIEMHKAIIAESQLEIDRMEDELSNSTIERDNQRLDDDGLSNSTIERDDQELGGDYNNQDVLRKAFTNADYEDLIKEYDMTYIDEMASNIGIEIVGDKPDLSPDIKVVENLSPELESWIGKSMPQNNYFNDGGSMSIIAEMNNINDVDKINVGDLMKFPLQDDSGNIIGFREIEVQKGDTLSDMYQSHRLDEMNLGSSVIGNVLHDTHEINDADMTPPNVNVEDMDKFKLMTEFYNVDNGKIDFRGAREFMFSEYMTDEEIEIYKENIVNQIHGLSDSDVNRLVDNFIEGNTNTRNSVDKAVYRALERDFNRHIASAITEMSEKYSAEIKEVTNNMAENPSINDSNKVKVRRGM